MKLSGYFSLVFAFATSGTLINATLRQSSSDISFGRDLESACTPEAEGLPIPDPAPESCGNPYGVFTSFVDCQECPTVQFSSGSLEGRITLGEYTVIAHLAVDIVSTGTKTFAMKPEGHRPVYDVDKPLDGIASIAIRSGSWCQGTGVRVVEIASDGSSVGTEATCKIRINRNGKSNLEGTFTFDSVNFPAVEKSLCGEFVEKDGALSPRGLQGTENKVPLYVRNTHKPSYRLPSNNGTGDDKCSILAGCKCYDAVSYSGGNDHKVFFFDPTCNDCTTAACGSFVTNNRCGPYDLVEVQGDCTVPDDTVAKNGSNDLGIHCTVTLSDSTMMNPDITDVEVSF